MTRSLTAESASEAKIKAIPCSSHSLSFLCPDSHTSLCPLIIRINTKQKMNQEILELKQKTIDSMVDYMKYGGAEDENDPEYDPEFDAGYTQEHVERCLAIVDELLDSLGKTPTAKKSEYILAGVKKTVLELNQLNEECDHSLIETDQREDLCELSITAARQAGLQSSVYDITEEWRDW